MQGAVSGKRPPTSKLMIPDELSPVETSAIWHSLTAEMQMAKDSAG